MNERFDELSRAMSGAMPRRKVLKMVGAAMVGAATASVLRPVRSSAFAATCSGPTTVGSSPCAAGTTPCGPCCCRAGIACLNAQNGTCGCPAGTTPCGQACCQKGVACGDPSTATCNGPVNSCLDGQVKCGTSCCPSDCFCATDATGSRCVRPVGQPFCPIGACTPTSCSSGQTCFTGTFGSFCCSTSSFTTC